MGRGAVVMAVLVIGAGAGASAGCGGGPGEPDAAGPADAGPGADAGPTRPYALASSGARLVLEPRTAIVLAPADLASDVDVALVHQEFYGLPWAAFGSGTDPPPEWVAVMDQLAAD